MASIAARKNVELRKKWLPVCFNDSTFIWCLKISWYWFISGAGQSAKDYIDNGKLVPDNVMVELILNELHGLKSESWLLDGEFVPQSFVHLSAGLVLGWGILGKPG